ncbi:MAG: hypothetical protein WKF94_09200 [Solirubrobacteraceae bacterium]
MGLSLAFLVGCGGDSEREADAEKPVSASAAISEIAAVRSGLDEALSTYESGDAEQADKQVGDAYLEHFELVEGPLEEVDAELNEKLEDSIREELREKMQADAPQTEVAKLVSDIKADLDTAEAALR